MSANLRVGVDAQLARISPRTGHGNVWHHLVEGLRDRVELVEIGARSPIALAGRREVGSGRVPDVLLLDGHSIGPQLRGAASVAIAYDVRWADPEQRRSVPVSFLTRVAPATETVVRASTITAVPSEFAAAGFRDLYGLDDSRIRVVPLGVDLAMFALARSRHDLGTARRPLALASGDPYVLFVGSVEPRKNIGVLRDAMQVVAEAGTRLRLAVRLSPAPGMDSRALLAAAVAPLRSGDALLDEVIVLPPLTPTEMADVISGAAAMCLPSSYEGFGLPVLEAMAAGVAVIVAARGSLPEIVGDGGIVVEPDPRTIGEALIRLLGDPSGGRSLAERGCDRAAQFSWDRTVSGVHELLEEASARSPVVRPSMSPKSWLVTAPIAHCPVCGEAVAAPHDAPPSAVTRCARCGAHHALEYHASGRIPADAVATMPPGWPTYLTDPAQFEQFQLDRADQLLDMLDADGARPGRLLDISCDTGALVTAAARRGWDATGVEPDASIAAMAEQRVGSLDARIVAGLDDVRRPFDVVVANDWLERAQSATAALRALRGLTADRGRVVVSTPNWRSAARRWDGEQWHHLRPYESVTYFDRVTLRRAFADADVPDVHVHCTTWVSDDLTIAAHTLVPIRRIALGRANSPHPKIWAGLRGILGAYDRCGIGDALVAIAHVGARSDPPAQEPVGAR